MVIVLTEWVRNFIIILRGGLNCTLLWWCSIRCILYQGWNSLNNLWTWPNVFKPINSSRSYILCAWCLLFSCLLFKSTCFSLLFSFIHSFKSLMVYIRLLWLVFINLFTNLIHAFNLVHFGNVFIFRRLFVFNFRLKFNSHEVLFRFKALALDI